LNCALEYAFERQIVRAQPKRLSFEKRQHWGLNGKRAENKYFDSIDLQFDT